MGIEFGRNRKGQEVKSKISMTVPSKKAQEVKIPKRNFPCLTSRKGQEEKPKFFMTVPSKKAQEEIMGFGIILVLIAVILVIFLGLSRGSDDSQDNSFEVDSFLGSILSVSTECEQNGNFVSLNELFFDCSSSQRCDNNLDSCEVLYDTVEEIMEVSWDVGENSSVKGYSFEAYNDRGSMINLAEGIDSGYYNGASRDFAKTGEKISIYLKIFY